MKTFTIDDVLELEPCGWDREYNGRNYERKHLEELSGTRKTLTLAAVIDMQDVPPEDVVWLFSKFATDRQNRIFAAMCAMSCLDIYEAKYPDDNRPRNAITTAIDFGDGCASADELGAAWSAAEAAAEAAWSAQLMFLSFILLEFDEETLACRRAAKR